MFPSFPECLRDRQFHVKQLFTPHQQDQLRDLCSPLATASAEEILSLGVKFISELISYNRTVPLMSRAGDQTARAIQLFLSSLAVLEFLPADRGFAAVDLGSGGGFPALPLKIVRSDSQWTLIESRQRKCAFLESVVGRLKLDGIDIACSRFEEYVFDKLRLPRVITSRAGPPMESILGWAQKIHTVEWVILFDSSTKPESADQAARKYGFYLPEIKEIGSVFDIESLNLLPFEKTAK